MIRSRTHGSAPTEAGVAEMAFARRLTAEVIGTALLLAAVVGSGIMAQRLAGGNVAVALLANSIATGGALVALILAFGQVSGAHFNPIVTCALASRKQFPSREIPAYVAAQIVGAVAGVVVANLMFGLPPIVVAQHSRAGGGQLLGEFIATFGLVAVIFGCLRGDPRSTPYAVAAYIVGAYWFTSSTSFANPAVTIARSLSDTFAGIRPLDVAPFIVAQIAGGGAATTLWAFLSATGVRREEPEEAPLTNGSREVEYALDQR